MVAIPHATKAQILSDLERYTIEEPSRVESEDESLLYLAFAHGAGFAGSPDQKKFHSWTTASAGSGSATASLILKVLGNCSLSHDTMLEAFSESVKHTTGPLCSRDCLFTSQDAESLLLASFTSADNCNPLHFLSFFCGFSDEPRHPDNFAVGMRRLDPDLRNEAPIRVLRRTVFRKLSVPSDRLLEGHMQRIVRYFGPQFIFGATAEPHYLHNHYPLSLTGTPLSFAVILNCVEAIRALLNEGAHPLDISGSETSDPHQYHSSHDTPLHAAISCHQKKLFVLLWENCLARGLGRQMYEDYVHPGHHGAGLVSTLAHKSVLERALLHCTNRQSAQTDMIGVLIKNLLQLSDTYGKHTQNPIHAIILHGIERIIALGDLDIATEILSLNASLFVTTRASIKNVFEKSLQMAVSGIFDQARSVEFLRFARGLGLGSSADVRALSAIMRWKCVALFYECLNEEIEINACDENGQSPLHHMIISGFYEVAPVSTLLRRGATVDRADSQGLAPLQLAVRSGLFDVVKQLLGACASPMVADHKGVSTLRYAVISRNVSVVAEILQALEQLTGGDSEDSRGLYTSNGDVQARHGKLDIDYGTVDGRIPEDGKTVLHISVENHDLEITTLLLAHGVNLHRADSEGNEALHYAIKSTKSNTALSLCKVLLDAGANAMPRNSAGEMPLHQALVLQLNSVNLKLLECFHKHQRYDINARDPGGQTLLHLAAAKGADVLVASLVEHGASAQIADSQGRTALHACAEAAIRTTDADPRVEKMPLRVQRMLTIVDNLLRAASDPFARDINGYTSVEYTAINGNSDLLCHLVRSISNHPTEYSHAVYRKELRKILSSAWSLSIEKEQWLLVNTLLLSSFDFKKDMSLLRWPVGARFFRYSMMDADSLPVHLRSRKKLIGWDNLPGRLRTKRIDVKLHQQWHPDECRFWEESVDLKEVHSGGDPLVEILDFIATWNVYILRAYFGPSWRPASASIHARIEEVGTILDVS